MVTILSNRRAYYVEILVTLFLTVKRMSVMMSNFGRYRVRIDTGEAVRSRCRGSGSRESVNHIWPNS